MKISTIVVLYNPKEQFFESFKRYADFSENIIFCDNSDDGRIQYNKRMVSNISKSVYINLCGNQGIAYALKKGMDEAKKRNADYVLTMDQDSSFPSEKIEDIKKILEKETEYGVIGLNFNSDNNGTIDDYEINDVRWWLTSGNFIKVECYNKTGGFDPSLFIDCVDADICYKMHKEGFKVGYIKNISIKHTIGNPTTLNFLGFKFNTLNYNPVRYYYIFRNNFYLHSIDRKFFRKDYFNVFVKVRLKILLFEKNKKEKFSAIKLGIKDGKIKKLGKLEETMFS